MPYRWLRDLTLAEWRAVFRVNVEGTFALCSLVGPLTAQRGQGRIINTAPGSVSERSLRPPCLGNSQTNDALRTRAGRPLVNRRFAGLIARNRSACAAVAVQKLGDNLDLIVRDQGRCMTAVLNCMNAHVAIPAYHLLENGFGK